MRKKEPRNQGKIQLILSDWPQEKTSGYLGGDAICLLQVTSSLVSLHQPPCMLEALYVTEVWGLKLG